MPRPLLAALLIAVAAPAALAQAAPCPCGSSCKCADSGKCPGCCPAVRIVKRPVWQADYDKALKGSEGRTVVVLFTDPIGCVPCKKLDAGALNDPAVRDALASCVCVKIDVSKDPRTGQVNAYGQFMLDHFRNHYDNVWAWPTIKVYRGGVRVADWRPTPGQEPTPEVLLKLIR
jgi:hypothetical protein